jgi:hypothetical protein
MIPTKAQVVACSGLKFDRNIATPANMRGASHPSDPADVEELAVVQRECMLMPDENNPGRLEMSLLDSAAMSTNECAGGIKWPCKVVSRRSVDQIVRDARKAQ